MGAFCVICKTQERQDCLGAEQARAAAATLPEWLTAVSVHILFYFYPL